nr:MAG TPA: hypothetical protein [Caudoviricetes sp.]
MNGILAQESFIGSPRTYAGLVESRLNEHCLSMRIMLRSSRLTVLYEFSTTSTAMRTVE